MNQNKGSWSQVKASMAQGKFPVHVLHTQEPSFPFPFAGVDYASLLASEVAVSQ